jgi:hypothetical protein
VTLPKTRSLLALAGAASLALPAAAAEAAAPPSPIDTVCRAVMGLEPGEARFVGCVDSLGGSLHAAKRDQALARSREACRDRGLEAGSPALAVCAVEGRGAVAATPIAAVDADAAPRAAKSWSYAPNGERRRRERLACASLGLDPTGQAFDGCAAGLAAALFAADNPQN